MLVKTRLVAGFFSIAGLGLILALSSIFSFSRIANAGIELGIKKAPLTDATMEVKLTAATADKMFEDIMMGLPGRDIEDVWNLLDDTFWYAKAIIEGGTNEVGTFLPADDEAIYWEVEMVLGEIIAFRKAAEARYELMTDTTSSGSAVDQAFDDLYSVLVDDMDRETDRFVRTGDIASVRNIQNARFILADSHLFLEEFLGGDDTVTLGEILAGFEEARAVLTSLQRRYGTAIAPLLEEAEGLIEAAGIRGENFTASRDTETDAVKAYVESYMNFVEGADIVEELVHDMMETYGENLYRYKTLGLIQLVFILIIILVASFVLSFATARRIALPLGRFQKLFVRGASGDLSVRSDISSKDEIGQMSEEFNGFMGRLEGIINTLKEEAIRLDRAGNDLTAGSAEAGTIGESMNREISSSREQVDQQAANVTETAAAVEQMARNIESLDSIVDEQVASVTESSASIEEMIASVSSIADGSKKAMGQVESLKAKSSDGQRMMSQSIETITQVSELSKNLEEANKVISSIAAQTNLLAMNAAIEAAHAGKAGAGFSVVADEIRKLAENSAGQSKLVNASLKEIVAAINQTVEMSRETDSVFQGVAEAVTSMADIFSELRIALDQQQESGATVLEELKRMNDMSQTVRNASAEMSAGNKEIVSAVEELDSGTSRFTGSFREIETQKDNVLKAFGNIKTVAASTAHVVESVNNIAGRFTTGGRDGEEVSDERRESPGDLQEL